MADKYNTRNPSVKRILQELKEMQSTPSHDFMSLPLEFTLQSEKNDVFGASDSFSSALEDSMGPAVVAAVDFLQENQL